MSGRLRSVLVDRALLLAMVLGLVLRLALVPLGEGEARFGTSDTRSYRRFSAELPSALWSPDDDVLDVTLQRAPGYPVLLLVMDADDGPMVQVIWVQALVGGVVTVALVHLLARRVASRRAAAVAALVVAIDPVSVAHAAQLMTETLYTCVSLAGVTLLWAATRPGAGGGVRWRRRGLVLLAGATLGAAALVRPQTTYLLVVASAGAGLLARRGAVGAPARPAPGWRRPVGVAALVLVGGMLVLGPWIVRNRVVSDRWLVSTSQAQGIYDIGAASADAEVEGVAWWPEPVSESYARQARATARLDATSPPVPPGTPVDEVWTERGARAIRDHPRGFVMVTSAALVRTVLGPADTLLLRLAGGDPSPAARLAVRVATLGLLGAQLALAAVGTAVLARRRSWDVLGLLVVPIVAYLLLSANPQVYARFRVPVVPYLAVLAGIGVAALRDRRRDDRLNRP